MILSTHCCQVFMKDANKLLLSSLPVPEWPAGGEPGIFHPRANPASFIWEHLYIKTRLNEIIKTFIKFLTVLLLPMKKVEHLHNVSYICSDLRSGTVILVPLRNVEQLHLFRREKRNSFIPIDLKWNSYINSKRPLLNFSYQYYWYVWVSK